MKVRYLQMTKEAIRDNQSSGVCQMQPTVLAFFFEFDWTGVKWTELPILPCVPDLSKIIELSAVSKQGGPFRQSDFPVSPSVLVSLSLIAASSAVVWTFASLGTSHKVLKCSQRGAQKCGEPMIGPGCGVSRGPSESRND